ncbi:AfsR/SARP family transcriptional regulator [Streptomyces sp. UNOC14_S4]|uniref:AfsR/SARP family transcriptional regulator n=1 Tax=Streptomyces sp. UNOC14_S4 TaxID=2872340 RepID=UPI001E31FA90|nr:AfsR/SARP family transcriptional regulator [Streptomyces sp. UNOC14_S4]
MLGPLGVLDSGTDRTPTAPKQRQLLALLLLHANRTVSMPRLVEELWEYCPPPSAVAAVHTYIMQLRRTLHGGSTGGGTSPGRLVTCGQGYRLQVGPEELDLTVFRSLARSGRLAREHEDAESAARHLRAALDVWRAQALPDVTAGPLLRVAVTGIERERLDAVVRRVHAELSLGHHHALIGELSALVHRHPANADLTGQLMLALYRSGRQADALAAFHRQRAVLREDLGAEPPGPVCRLYQDILTAHPRLELPAPARAGLSLDLFAAMAC